MTGNAAGEWTPSDITIVRQTELIPRKRSEALEWMDLNGFGGRFG